MILSNGDFLPIAFVEPLDFYIAPATTLFGVLHWPYRARGRNPDGLFAIVANTHSAPDVYRGSKRPVLQPSVPGLWLVFLR